MDPQHTPIPSADAERLHTFAHDLRNRLIGLQQVIERLADEPAPAEREEFLEYGQRQFFAALREVERLMDDMGVERNTVRPEVGAVHVADLLRDRFARLSYRFERKAQPVTIDCAENLTIQGDARILGDIIDALLTNASKFSHTDQEILVSARSTIGHVEIVVHDRGIGLSTEDLQQIFIRFAWIPNKPTHGEAQGRGTLARARSWAQAHGGDLFAASPGRGAGCSFTLRLPTA